MQQHFGSACACAGRIGNMRILRELDVVEGPTGEGEPEGRHVGIAIDIETTGLDRTRCAIIELAMRRFRFDDDGVITAIGQPYCWLEDPGEHLPPDIVELTGLTDADLVGERIDDATATRLLRSASLVVAHHSRFDRPWVEQRLKDARGLPWACSMEQIDWRTHGFEGRSLGFLLMQAGYFHDGHRAATDVDALIQLLRHGFDDGRTALFCLIDRAARPSWIFSAKGAAYALKDVLRARGYRWNPDSKCWWREVPDEERAVEEFWLAEHVYDGAAHPRASGPDITQVTPRTRFL